MGARDHAVDVVNSFGEEAPSSGLRPPFPPARGRRDSAESLLRPSASFSAEAEEKGQGGLEDGTLKACPTGNAGEEDGRLKAHPTAMAGEDEAFWLVPIEDRRATGGTRIGISPRMDLAAYLRRLDWSSRLLRPGKCRVPKDVCSLLARLGTNADVWKFRLEKLQGVDRLFGTVFSTKRSDINRFAEARGVKKLSNLNGCPG